MITESLVIKLLLAAIVIFINLVGYLLKCRIDKVEKDITDKVSAEKCGLLHTSVVDDVNDIKHHKHAPVTPDGRGGEVIFR